MSTSRFPRPDHSWAGFDDKELGGINIHHPVFQQGRNLYDAQVMCARLEAGETPDPAEVYKLAREMCWLINAVGQLRAEYDRLRERLADKPGLIKKLLGG